MLKVGSKYAFLCKLNIVSYIIYCPKKQIYNRPIGSPIRIIQEDDQSISNGNNQGNKPIVEENDLLSGDILDLVIDIIWNSTDNTTYAANSYF